MSADDIAREMREWVGTERGEMVRSSTIERHVADWADRLVPDGLTWPTPPTMRAQNGAPIWLRGSAVIS